VYFTSCDNQQKAEIKIYQGEHEIAPRNTYLGEFLVEGLTRAPAGAVQIVVSFDYDANGMLQVKAQERGSANVRELTVTTLGTGIEPHGTPASAHAPVSASAVLARARAVLQRASKQDRRRLEEAIARLEQAIAARGDDVSSREQALLDILYEID
jgi:molecular chaperone DnaK